MDNLFNPANFRDLGALTVVTLGVLLLVVYGFRPMLATLIDYLRESRKYAHDEEKARVEADRSQTKALEALTKQMQDQAQLYDLQRAAITDLVEAVRVLRGEMALANQKMTAVSVEREQRLGALQTAVNGLPERTTQQVRAALDEPLKQQAQRLDQMHEVMRAVPSAELVAINATLQALVPQLENWLRTNISPDAENAQSVCAREMKIIAERLGEMERVLRINQVPGADAGVTDETPEADQTAAVPPTEKEINKR